MRVVQNADKIVTKMSVDLNNNQKKLFQLIKQSQFGISENESFFAGVDWNDVFDEAVSKDLNLNNLMNNYQRII